MNRRSFLASPALGGPMIRLDLGPMIHVTTAQFNSIESLDTEGRFCGITLHVSAFFVPINYRRSELIRGDPADFGWLPGDQPLGGPGSLAHALRSIVPPPLPGFRRGSPTAVNLAENPVAGGWLAKITYFDIPKHPFTVETIRNFFWGT